MPRYYKRKIFDDYPDIKEIVNAKLALKVVEKLAREVEAYHALYPELKGYEIMNLIKQFKEQKNESERNKELGRDQSYKRQTVEAGLPLGCDY